VRVTRVPLSADGSFLICLKPRRATTLSGFWTVVMPVSSTFQISGASKSNRCYTVYKLKKKKRTDIGFIKGNGSCQASGLLCPQSSGGSCLD
jgi:hypothetical protein